MYEFEGYVGVGLWNEQLVNDLFFSLLLGLLTVFAVIFRANYRLFSKMIRDVVHVKDRSSLFENTSGNDTVFHFFMIFQSLFLCSLAIFQSAHELGYLDYYPDMAKNIRVIGLLFVALIIFYFLKQIMYVIIASISSSVEQYKTWRIGYTAATELWGILLYIPVLWMTFIKSHKEIPVILFGFIFILWRLIVIYKSIRIFNINSIGILYVFLYLCGQEILPLLFLYEGIDYLYNFIDELALWY